MQCNLGEGMLDIHGNIDPIAERSLLSQGRMLQENGDFQKSLEVLNEVIEGNPKNDEAFYIIGNIFHRNGDIGKAIKAFSKVLEIAPGHTDAAISLSVLYNDIGKYEKAKEIFEKAQEKVQSQGRPQIEVARPKVSEPQSAEKTISAVNDPHIDKKFAYKHLELADLYMSYSRFDEAMFEYKKVITLDSNNYEARIKIAKTYAKKGFISKACDELITLKNEKPDYIPARLALGMLYFSNKKIIEAQTEWQKVLEKDPKNEEALMYLTMSESATEISL